MSAGGYTGNPGPKIYPFVTQGDNPCFRFTNKSANECERAVYNNYFQEPEIKK